MDLTDFPMQDEPEQLDADERFPDVEYPGYDYLSSSGIRDINNVMHEAANMQYEIGEDFDTQSFHSARSSVSSSSLGDLQVTTNLRHVLSSGLVSPIGLADTLRQSSPWIIGFVVLTFDIDVGQKIDAVYPPTVELDDLERNDIRFSSFPDTSALIGDTAFSFRARAGTGLRHPKTEHYHGYVFFRQKRDFSIRRGFLQKSIVLLSLYPFPGLFLRVVAITGSIHLNSVIKASPAETPIEDTGLNVIEHAYREIAGWPRPEPATLLDLHFMGIHLHVELPLGCGSHIDGNVQLLETSCFVSRPGNAPPSARLPLTCEQILASIPCTLVFPTGFLAYLPMHSWNEHSHTPTIPSPFFDVGLTHAAFNDIPGTSLGLFYRFQAMLDHLWTLWELVLLGEPVVVIGRSQCVVSECVWWLTQLTKPVPFCGDYRPYFTIQNSDYGHFVKFFMNNEVPLRPSTSKQNIGASVSPNTTPIQPSGNEQHFVIVGVTNPFFINAFENWPHVLRVGGTSKSTSESSGDISEKPRGSSSPSSTIFNRSPKSSPLDMSPGLSTTHKPFIAKDSKLIKALLAAYDEGTAQSMAKKSKVPEFTESFQAFFSPASASSGASASDMVDKTLNRISRRVSVSKQSRRYKGYVLNEILRRHFVDLTEHFLAPFNRFFSTLIPTNPAIPPIPASATVLQYAGKAFRYVPPPSVSSFKIKAFDTNQFMKQLIEHGPPSKILFRGVGSLSSRTDSLSSSLKNTLGTSKSLGKKSTPHWAQFYSRFLESPGMAGWLKERKLIAESQLRFRFLEGLCQFNLDSLKSTSEQDVTYLSLFLILRRECTWCGVDVVHASADVDFSIPETAHFLMPSSHQLHCMRSKAEQLWTQFPRDLQELLISGAADYMNDPTQLFEDDVLLII